MCKPYRMRLTRFGVWIGKALAQEDYGDAAALAERVGFGALWLGGSPRLLQVRPMLEATGTLVIATGIVNIWQYEPDELAAEFWALEEEFPDRLLLGIGIGHPEATSEYRTPLTKTREFLDGLSAAERPVPRERMTLAALGPKMLDLSLERTLGPHPYFTPPAHTRLARERLGAEAWIAPEQAVVLDAEAESALATARTYADRYLALSNYANNLRRLGYSDDALAEGGSPAMIDEMVPQGDAEAVAGAVHAHLDAGADHVCVQAVGARGIPTREWAALGATLFA
jgi:probable F420-dependent oxidoreductase